MAKYLHKFTSLAEFEAAYNGSDYHEPWVSLTKDELKIFLIASYSGNPEFVLRYVENASVTIDGDTEDAYIWQIESGDEYLDYYAGDYIATATKDDGEYTIDAENNDMIKVTKVGDQWSVPQGTHSYEIGKITTISNSGKVDYNKHPFTGDLIVEGVNKSGGETGDITYANSDYFGELTCDGNCNEVAQYTCSGPISEGTGKEPLNVRVINADEEQKDYIFEQTENMFPVANSMEWRCSDSSCPIYVTYADYSGGSPIVLKANEV